MANGYNFLIKNQRRRANLSISYYISQTKCLRIKNKICVNASYESVQEANQIA